MKKALHAYYLSCAIFGSLTGYAIAQQPAPIGPDYGVTLTGQEWFQIGEALSERPFKIANPILAKINSQITTIAVQRQKEAEEKAKAVEPKPAEKE